MKTYVLVAEVNEYNQHGKYYVKAWANEPVKEDVLFAIEESSFLYKSVDIDLVMETIRDPLINTRTDETVGEDSWFSFVVEEGS